MEKSRKNGKNGRFLLELTAQKRYNDGRKNHPFQFGGRNMKRLFALLLAIALLVPFAACGTSSPSEPAGSNHTASSETAENTEVSEEITRAISYGLVPETLQGDYGKTVTFSQYCEMLTNLIRLWDEDRVNEWEELIALAAASDEEMRREDGILATAYAMVLMEKNAPGDFFYLDIDEVSKQLDSNGDTPTWDYPLFPTWEETGFEWCNSNYLWGGVTTCAILISRVSGKAIYPYDFEGKSAHLEDPLTREEAICAVLRLGEIDSSVLEPDGNYIELSEVGTYDETILTEKLLHAASDLPEVTQAKLPTEWKGAGLSSSKNDGGGAECTDFRETDIKFLADNGFNFARIFLGFSTLRFPNYPEDASLVNENELRDLDQLIAWGMEYGVHIQISMSFYLDENGNDKKDDTIAANDAEWALVQEYWTMLARRYAGIPSQYLTFDLCNEVQPAQGEDVSYPKEKLGELISSVRAADSERVLLYSFQGNPNADWVDAAASLGVAIGCHPYYPQYITTTGWEYAEQNPYASPSWPQPWFPMGKVQDGAAPLILQGDLSGAELSLHIDDGVEGTDIAVYADETLVKTITLSGGTPTEGDEPFLYQTLYPITLPEGTSEVTIQVAEGGYAKIDTIRLSGSMGEVVMVPHDIADYPDRSDPLPLIIQADGTYTNSEDRFVDGDEIYQTDVKPYQDIAAKYGVGFMVNEFGIFGTNVNWDNDVVAAYHDTVLQMLTEQNIGWCYCELYNPIPNHLTLMPVSGQTEFQWQNATKEAVTISCESGKEMEYWVNRELMDVFEKYTKS